jgi:hypothetical protein
MGMKMHGWEDKYKRCSNRKKKKMCVCMWWSETTGKTMYNVNHFCASVSMKKKCPSRLCDNDNYIK